MADSSAIPITVLISGSGTNLQALIDARLSSDPEYRIVRVISNRKAAYGLIRAQNAGIPTAYHNLVSYKKKTESEQEARIQYDADLASLILKDEPKLVVCAGFMHVLSPAFLDPLTKAGVSIINLHPAKWGEFDGAGAIERAHQAFMDGKITETGVMIHYVVAEVDRGRVVVQESVPMTHPEDDNVDKLEEKIHKVEHVLIVQGTLKAIGELKSK